MSYVIAHLDAASLPLSLDAAGLSLAVGFLVLLMVAYDLYRHRGSGGG